MTPGVGRRAAKCVIGRFDRMQAMKRGVCFEQLAVDPILEFQSGFDRFLLDFRF